MSIERNVTTCISIYFVLAILKPYLYLNLYIGVKLIYINFTIQLIWVEKPQAWLLKTIKSDFSLFRQANTLTFMCVLQHYSVEIREHSIFCSCCFPFCFCFLYTNWSLLIVLIAVKWSLHVLKCLFATFHTYFQLFAKSSFGCQFTLVFQCVYHLLSINYFDCFICVFYWLCSLSIIWNQQI